MASAVPSQRLILRAAQLRAEGLSWEAIGQAVGRSRTAVSRWPWRYQAIWERGHARAAGLLAQDANAESVQTLRSLLRSPDEKIRRDAAQRLMHYNQTRQRSHKRTHPQDTPLSHTSIDTPASDARLSDADLEAHILALQTCLENDPTSSTEAGPAGASHPASTSGSRRVPRPRARR